MAWSHALAAATVGLLAVSVPASAAAQGCTAHSCTAVNQVQVTVPQRLSLNAAGPSPMVRANTAWRLQVSTVQAGTTVAAASGSSRSTVTEIRDTPAPSVALVRYTLIGS